MVFQRFLDAVDWLENAGFIERFNPEQHFWDNPDGRLARVFRDIDNTGQDDSRTEVVIHETGSNIQPLEIP